MRRVASLLVGLVLACAPLAHADEWFDAYERGLDALAHKDAARAAQQFERAISLRADPGTNLFTYGTNRLAAYHPYLRLAEARLMKGDVAGARAALVESERRGREPAASRARLSVLVAAAEKPAAPTPVPSTLPAPPEAATAVVTTPTSTAAPAPAATTTPAATPTPEAPRDRAPSAATTPRVLAPAAAVASAIVPEPRPSPASATLEVFTQPGGALVYLNDEPLGHSDSATGRLVKTGLAPGAHRLRASRLGWRDTATEVTLGSGEGAPVRLVLSRHPAWLQAMLGLAAAAVVAASVLLLRQYMRRARSTGKSTAPLTGHSRETVVTPRVTPQSTPRSSGSQVSGATSFEESFPTLPRSRPRIGSAKGSETFGEYVLVELLGRGGMAHVYRAERRGEQFALKRPLLSLLHEAEFLERFVREADLGRALHHPNIVRIFERGEVDGVPYFTMELVEGETLHGRLRRGPLPVLEATDLVCQVAEALDYAHLKGVVHRDLKPSNIMILDGGAVKVMDYGIARARRYEGLTATGAFLGTPEYAAPESAEGHGWDSRSDLYSLGVTFYETLTGRKPFVGETAYATMRMHCSEAPTPPSALTPVIPRTVESVVLRLLAKKPEERYASAEELLVELREYLSRADRAV